MSGWATWAGAALTTGVLLVLLLRWTSISSAAVVVVVGLTPLLIVPLAASGILALQSREPVLGAVVVVVLLGYLLTVQPWNAVFGCGASSTPSNITVLTMNTYRGSADAERIAELAIEHNPDVLVLQETTPRLIDELAEDRRFDAYIERSQTVLTDVTGLVLWSRWPVAELRKWPTGRRSVPQARILADVGEFTVTAVHNIAPSSGPTARRWQLNFEGLRRLDAATPHIVVGDFNATEDHGQFRSLLGRGWTDAHSTVGCGLRATWPVGRVSPFPFLRLDHVLVSEHFGVVDVELISDTGGSDHKAVLAHLHLPDL